jgi:DNA-directed RNA polymerase specialized sigma24 family protein
MAQELHHPPDMATYPDQTQLISERLLLPRARAGDYDAFVLLGSMHSQQVYAIARNLSSSEGSALELTQNAFQQAWKELTAIPPKLSYRIFVCRFLIKEAVDRLGHPDLSVSAWLERFFPSSTLADACQHYRGTARSSRGWLAAANLLTESAKPSQVSIQRIGRSSS